MEARFKQNYGEVRPTPGCVVFQIQKDQQISEERPEKHALV